jgi:hypothetical protein
MLKNRMGRIWLNYNSNIMPKSLFKCCSTNLVTIGCRSVVNVILWYFAFL